MFRHSIGNFFPPYLAAQGSRSTILAEDREGERERRGKGRFGDDADLGRVGESRWRGGERRRERKKGRGGRWKGLRCVRSDDWTAGNRRCRSNISNSSHLQWALLAGKLRGVFWAARTSITGCRRDCLASRVHRGKVLTWGEGERGGEKEGERERSPAINQRLRIEWRFRFSR